MRRVSPSAFDCTVKVSPMTSGVAVADCAASAGSAAIKGAAEMADNNSGSTMRRMGKTHPGKEAEHSAQR
ncbi:hypothetical protein G6F68_015151 [Rhizopus microsporus]|nr:hypothetical protein G6F24_016633 [Rhizopus arrhizus]KAG1245213.1 hypothetical protein G6F68_015151 [Rhizopus microsporus]